MSDIHEDLKKEMEARGKEFFKNFFSEKQDQEYTSTLSSSEPPVFDLEILKESIAAMAKLPPLPVKMNCSPKAIEIVKSVSSKGAVEVKELYGKISNAWSLSGLPFYEVDFLKEGEVEIEYNDGSKKIIEVSNDKS